VIRVEGRMPVRRFVERLGIPSSTWGETLPAALEELLLPFGDRRLAHLEPPRDHDLGHLALEHAEHDGELLVGRLERLAAHLVTTSSEPDRDHSPECPTQSDAPHPYFTYYRLFYARKIYIVSRYTGRAARFYASDWCPGAVVAGTFGTVAKGVLDIGLAFGNTFAAPGVGPLSWTDNLVGWPALMSSERTSSADQRWA
jgi:hypothetical protein